MPLGNETSSEVILTQIGVTIWCGFNTNFTEDNFCAETGVLRDKQVKILATAKIGNLETVIWKVPYLPR